MTTTEFYAEISNKTAYGIESNALRYIWAGYYLFVIASSLIGDTTILIASIKYKAFKLHRVIVVIIQHIAFCDLMVSVTYVLPNIVSVTSDKWVLGNFFCYFCSYAKYYSNVTSVYLICAMTTSKLLLLKFPFRFGTTTSKKAHLICVVCWLAAFILPVTLLLENNDVSFSYRGYLCNYVTSSEIWHYLKPIIAVLILFIPTCLVVSTTICLLIEARKIVSRSRESLKWQGIMTTVLTATVFCLSLLPYVAYYVWASFVSVNDKSKSSLYTTFYRVAISLLSLNTISNFYIYCLTVSSFRAFIWSTMQLSYQYITNVGTSASHGNIRNWYNMNINIMDIYLSTLIVLTVGF